jgi:phosphoenolpyruvate-protein kinase (PTS system EI component)
MLQRQAFCLNSAQIVGRVVSSPTDIDRYPNEMCVLAVDRLSPAELIPILELERIGGVVVRKGSLVDHTAVLLNARGMQLAYVPNLPDLAVGTAILVDGNHDRVWSGSTITALQAHLCSIDIEEPLTSSYESPLEYEGERVLVYVDGKTDAEFMAGIHNGAHGVGILRTEWLHYDKAGFPDTLIHRTLYATAATKVHPYRLNIRLFDLGGDKIPCWARGAAEQIQSPLGARGIRAFPFLEEAFSHQLKAICEVADETPLGIVIPMVTNVHDILCVKQRLIDLAGEGIVRKVSIGAMIEVPAAALQIDQLLPEVDFFRIGPGDLTQFTLAKLRSDIVPEEFSGRSMPPSVLALIEHVLRICKQADKPVALCLDLEPRETLLKSLLTKGIRTFCVSPSNISITVRRLARVCF